MKHGIRIVIDALRALHARSSGVEDARHDHQEQDHLEAHAVPLFEGRLRRPAEERDDVVRHLRHACLGAVGIGDLVRVERRRHLDLVAGEVLVVVHSLEHLEVGRGVLVAGRDRVDVIGAALARLRNQRQIGRQGAVVGGARRLVVGKRPGDRIGRPRRALIHLAAVVRPVGHLDLGGDALDLVLAVADRDEIAEIEVEAALQRSAVKGAEHAVERPLLMRRARGLLLGVDCSGNPAQKGERRRERGKMRPHLSAFPSARRRRC